MQHEGQTLPAFSVQTLAPPDLPHNAEDRADRVRAFSRIQYAQTKDDVDTEMQKRYQRNSGTGSNSGSYYN